MCMYTCMCLHVCGDQRSMLVVFFKQPLCYLFLRQDLHCGHAIQNVFVYNVPQHAHLRAHVCKWLTVKSRVENASTWSATSFEKLPPCESALPLQLQPGEQGSPFPCSPGSILPLSPLSDRAENLFKCDLEQWSPSACLQAPDSHTTPSPEFHSPFLFFTPSWH